MIEPRFFLHLTPEDRASYRKHRREMETDLPAEWLLDDAKIAKFLSAKQVSVDTETIPECPETRQLKYPVKKYGTTYLTDITHISLYTEIDDQMVMAVITQPITEKELTFLDELMQKDEIEKVWQNSSFDIKLICGKYNISVPMKIFDTLAASAVLKGSYGGDPKFYRSAGLDKLCEMYGVDRQLSDFIDSSDTPMLEHFRMAASGQVEDTLNTVLKELSTQSSPKLTKLITSAKVALSKAKDTRAAKRAREQAIKKAEKLILQAEIEYCKIHDDDDAESLNMSLSAAVQVHNVINGMIPEIAWYEYMKQNRFRLHELPAKDVALYALTDAWATYHVMQEQLAVAQEMFEQGYSGVYDALQEAMRAQAVQARIAARGLPLNIPYMEWLLGYISQRKVRLQRYFINLGCGDMTKPRQQFRYVFNVVGCTPPKPFVPSNGRYYPAEMEQRLWTDAAIDAGIKGDIEKIKKAGGRYWSTGSDALEWYEREHPAEIRLLQYYNSLVATEATIMEYLGHSQEDGRLHPNFTFANSLRSNASGPNTLNVNMKAPHLMTGIEQFIGDEESLPEETPLLPDKFNDNGEPEVYTVTCRGFLMAKPGHILVEQDGSNAESRFMALTARDAVFARNFLPGQDLHSNNARAYFPRDVAAAEKLKDDAQRKNRLKELRSAAKSPFFASGYGAGLFSLAAQLFTPVNIVREMMNSFATTYPGIERAKADLMQAVADSFNSMQQMRIKAHRSGYITLWNGRRVWVETLFSKRWYEPKAYTGFNSAQQGGVAAVVNETLWVMDRWLSRNRQYTSDIYTQYHDAIIWEVPVDNVSEAVDVLMEGSRILSTRTPASYLKVDDVWVALPFGADWETVYKWSWRWDKDNPSHIDGLPMPTGLLDEYKKKIEYPWEESIKQCLRNEKQSILEQYGDDNVLMTDMLSEGPFPNGKTYIPAKDHKLDIGNWHSDNGQVNVPEALQAARIAEMILERKHLSKQARNNLAHFVRFMYSLAEVLERMKAVDDKIAWIDQELKSVEERGLCPQN